MVSLRLVGFGNEQIHLYFSSCYLPKITFVVAPLFFQLMSKSVLFVIFLLIQSAPTKVTNVQVIFYSIVFFVKSTV